MSIFRSSRIIFSLIVTVLCLISSSLAQHPVITITGITKTQTSFTPTWTTDIPSDTMVFYGIGDHDMYGLDQGAIDCPTNDGGAYPGRCLGTGSSTGVTSHSQTVSNLPPGSVINFCVRSRAFTAGVPDNNKASTACNATIMLDPATSGGLYDFWVGQPTGTHYINQGTSSYITLNWRVISGQASRNWVRLQFTSVPSGITISDPNGGNCSSNYDSGTKTFSWYDIDGCSPSAYLKLTAALDATIGTSPLLATITTDGGQPAPKSFSWDIIVIAPDTPLSSGTPVGQQIPCLTSSGPNSKKMDGSSCTQSFESLMVKWGQWWCVPDQNARNNGAAGYDTAENGAWYYDARRAYYQIEKYDTDHGVTGNPSQWHTCATNWGTNYDNYVLVNGVSKRYHVFTHGGWMDWTQNGNATAKTAVNTLATNVTNSPSGLIGPIRIREAAYELDGAHYNYLLGFTETRIPRLVDSVIGILRQIILDQSEVYQPFQIGLAAESLIKCYDDGTCNDARIPPLMKQIDDFIFTNNYYPAGRPCSVNNLPELTYNSYIDKAVPDSGGIDSGCGGSDYASLNLLYATVPAWLYKKTGDITYANRARTLFQGAVMVPEDQGMGWMGKQWTQNYRWSFALISDLSMTSVPSTNLIRFSGRAQGRVGQ